MKALEAAIKNNRWLKSDCTPQFTSGPPVPFRRRWRQQSPSSELQPKDHGLSHMCWRGEALHRLWLLTPQAAAIPSLLQDSRIMAIFWYFVLQLNYFSCNKDFNFKIANQRAVRRIRSLENVAHEQMMMTEENTRIHTWNNETEEDLILFPVLMRKG